MTARVTITNSGTHAKDLVMLKGVKETKGHYANLSGVETDILILRKNESIDCLVPSNHFDEFVFIAVKGQDA